MDAISVQHSVSGKGKDTVLGYLFDNKLDKNNAKYAEKTDFTHMFATIAAHYDPTIISDVAGLGAGIFGIVSDTPFNVGYAGDIFGFADIPLIGAAKPSMGPDDYTADLDAVNIYNRASDDENMLAIMDEYFKEVSENNELRAVEFAENLGGSYEKGLKKLKLQVDIMKYRVEQGTYPYETDTAEKFYDNIASKKISGINMKKNNVILLIILIIMSGSLWWCYKGLYNSRNQLIELNNYTDTDKVKYCMKYAADDEWRRYKEDFYSEGIEESTGIRTIGWNNFRVFLQVQAIPDAFLSKIEPREDEIPRIYIIISDRIFSCSYGMEADVVTYLKQFHEYERIYWDAEKNEYVPNERIEKWWGVSWNDIVSSLQTNNAKLTEIADKIIQSVISEKTIAYEREKRYTIYITIFYGVVIIGGFWNRKEDSWN